MFSLPVQSSNFPTGGPNGSTSLPVSMAKLCWAALTVGKPNKLAAKAFGQHSTYEALFRWNMVRSALDLNGSGGVKNSDLFNALDPTEKGGINYYLGMIFLKICAQDILKTPWMSHFSWMKNNHTLTSATNQSTPDLLGYNPVTMKWNVFEAKGRNAGFSSSIMTKAKNQANQLYAVDGTNCLLHVGSQLCRDSSKSLHFCWVDPEPEGREPIELKTDQQTWLQYYGLIYALYEEQEKPKLVRSDAKLGIKIEICEPALKLISALNSSDHVYDKELDELFKWSVNQLSSPSSKWNGDGISISIDESLG